MIYVLRKVVNFIDHIKPQARNIKNKKLNYFDINLCKKVQKFYHISYLKQKYKIIKSYLIFELDIIIS